VQVELQYTTMEWKFLHNDDRMILWRNAIQLFNIYTNFVGPFKAAGFDKFFIEASLHTKDGTLINPDIISSSNEGWLIMDVSFSQNSKKENLEIYRDANPRNLNLYGLKIQECDPDILSGRLESIDDGNVCKLILKDKLKVENPNCIKNRVLAKELMKVEGRDLSKLPQISISLIPEMESKTGEIRRGLVDIVMQIFDPSCEGKSLLQIVDEGLDILADVTVIAKKEALMDKVDNQMGLLIHNHLKEYLEFKDNKYKATEKFKSTHHVSREAVSNGIREWAFSKQTTINGYQGKKGVQRKKISRKNKK